MTSIYYQTRNIGTPKRILFCFGVCWFVTLWALYTLLGQIMSPLCVRLQVLQSCLCTLYIIIIPIYTSSNCPHYDNQQSTSIHPVIKTERPMTSDIIRSNNIAVCYNSPERRSHRDLSQTFRSRPPPGTLCDPGEKV